MHLRTPTRAHGSVSSTRGREARSAARRCSRLERCAASSARTSSSRAEPDAPRPRHARAAAAATSCHALVPNRPTGTSGSRSCKSESPVRAAPRAAGGRHNDGSRPRSERTPNRIGRRRSRGAQSRARGMAARPRDDRRTKRVTRNLWDGGRLVGVRHRPRHALDAHNLRSEAHHGRAHASHALAVAQEAAQQRAHLPPN